MDTNYLSIAFAVIFNTGMILFTLGIICTIASFFVYSSFECCEKGRIIYNQDARYYQIWLHPDDKDTTISQWKRDRFAYSVWKSVLKADNLIYNQRKTSLPFAEWIKTVNPRKVEWWRIFGNQNISPEYPGAKPLHNPEMVKRFNPRP